MFDAQSSGHLRCEARCSENIPKETTYPEETTYPKETTYPSGHCHDGKAAIWLVIVTRTKFLAPE